MSAAGHGASVRKHPGNDEPGELDELPLEEVGEDPDPRFTFANERTFLAWNRTALALIGAGLAVAQLLDFRSEVTRLLVSLPLIVLGGLTAMTSYQRWVANERAIRLGLPLTYSRLPRLLALGIAAMGLVAAVATLIEVAHR